MSQPSVYHPEISMEMSRQQNQSPYKFDRNVSRDPERIITIFTVNMREQYSVSGARKFAGREKGERYRKVGSISDPTYFVDNEAVEGSADRKTVKPDDGEWVAMDWLNPQNIFKLDQDYQVQNATDDGTNLLARGLFYIVRPFDVVNGNVDDKPTEVEIKAAETRLRVRYTALVRLYHQTSTASPSKLPNIMSEEMIDALNYAGLKTPYNTTLEQKVECQYCGDLTKAGLKYHKSEALGGRMCIEPTQEGWKAAVYGNAVSRDDVPEEFRWAGRLPNPK